MPQVILSHRLSDNLEQSVYYPLYNTISIFIFQYDDAIFGEKTDVDDPVTGKLYYSSVKYQGHEYKIGDCLYLEPGSFTFPVKPAPVKKMKYDRAREVST